METGHEFVSKMSGWASTKQEPHFPILLSLLACTHPLWPALSLGAAAGTPACAAVSQLPADTCG